MFVTTKHIIMNKVISHIYYEQINTRAFPYQGNNDMSHKHWNILSSERCILQLHVLLEWCYVLMESSQWENWYHLFCRKASFLTAPHCRFRGVGQYMKQTYLYLWYPLFQAEWDRSDQHNYLVKGHHLYSGTWNQRTGLPFVLLSKDI
jgi:hypothetical protein